MKIHWKKIRFPLIALWALVISLCIFGSYTSLEERYNEQECLMRRALVLQRKVISWRRFLDKEPKKKSSEAWIHKLEKIQLLQNESKMLKLAKAHPLVENEKSLNARLDALKSNRLIFDIRQGGKCTLKKAVDMNAQDLENLLSELENEMQRAPFEITKFEIVRCAKRLEGEVFELKQLELTL